jgi:hypothetical protein
MFFKVESGAMNVSYPSVSEMSFVCNFIFLSV